MFDGTVESALESLKTKVLFFETIFRGASAGGGAAFPSDEPGLESDDACVKLLNSAFKPPTDNGRCAGRDRGAATADVFASNGLGLKVDTAGFSEILVEIAESSLTSRVALVVLLTSAKTVLLLPAFRAWACANVDNAGEDLPRW